jgi:signal transduction histidine kinase/ActR/RegA family two-component response regulator
LPRDEDDLESSPRESERARAQRFLTDAGRLLAASLDYETTLAEVAQLAVPAIADWCFIDLVCDDGASFERVAVAHRDPADADLARALERRYPIRRDLGAGASSATAARRPELRRDVDAALLRRLAADDAHLRELERLRMTSFVDAPLVVRGESIGTLTWCSSRRNLTEHDLWLIGQTSRSAAAAIDNARLFRAERRARVRISRMHEVTAAMSRARTAAEVAEAACRIGAEAMHARAAAMWLADEDGDLELAGCWATEDSLMHAFRRIARDDEAAPATRVLRSREPLWVEDEAVYARAAPRVFEAAKSADRASAFAAVPLVAEGEALGVLVFSHPPPHAYDADDRAFHLTLAEHCAQALERARLLDAAQEAARRAESANRTKDDLLATVSHELRTPLNAITGWIQMLRNGTIAPQKRDHALEVIERNARAQEQLISDLLDVSRVISGRLRLNVDRVDLAAVIGMAIEAVRPLAVKKGVALHTRLSALDEPLVGDADRLQQIVWNLLTNAVKFTPEGGRVDVELGTESPQVVLRVRDTGEGLRPELAEAIFEPFRQADSSFARRFGGLGLGLAITKTLVEMHGGTIAAKSEGEGRGAELVVRLPLAGLRPEATPRVPALGPARRRRARAAALDGVRVLIVEDEPDSRELLLSLLEDRGATVTGASNVADALAQLAKSKPDLVVSDIGLPGEDGLSLIRRIRATPEGARIPAAALTAFVRAEDRARALAAGFDTHVPKPIDPEKLVATLKALLATNRAANDSVL